MTEQQAENIVEAIDLIASARARQYLQMSFRNSEAVAAEAESAVRTMQLLKEALMEESR